MSYYTNTNKDIERTNQKQANMDLLQMRQDDQQAKYENQKEDLVKLDALFVLLKEKQLNKIIRYLNEYHQHFGTTELDYRYCYTPAEKRYHTMLKNFIEELEQLKANQ